MILGLKGKMQEIYEDLNSIRRGNRDLPENLENRDVTLTEYLGSQYKEGLDANGKFDIGHLYYELGVDPSQMTVAALIDLDQDSRWLVPEIFRDAIRKGIRTSPFYTRVITGNETVAQPQVNMPFFDLSDAEPADTEEAEQITKGSISYGNKTVNIQKHAIGIEITYEAIQYTNINLLTIFLQDMGIKLGQKLNNELVDIAINGDQEGGSEAAAVVGVDNPQVGLLYRDMLHVWVRGSRLGRVYDHVIGGEAMIEKIMELDEFKQKQQGTPISGVVVNETIPSQSQLFVSAQVPDNQIIMLDPRLAFVQLTSAPLLVEGEKIVNKQIEGTYASITSGFANIFRDARVIVDQTLDIANDDFPAWMTPTL